MWEDFGVLVIARAREFWILVVTDVSAFQLVNCEWRLRQQQAAEALCFTVVVRPLSSVNSYFEWRDDENGDSEDGEDDELPCVIGESEGDCIWRGLRSGVRSIKRCSIRKRAISDFQRGTGPYLV